MASVDGFERAAAVIFDMDGLLVDSEPFWLSVETEVFAGIGMDIGPVVSQGPTMGMRVDDAVAFFRACFGFEHPSDEELVARILEGMVQAIRTEAKLQPGAIEALQYCENHGLVIALASGSVSPVINAVLERFQLAGRFAAVCSAEDDAFGKPHPAIFLRTAQQLGVDPSECVVLEDSVNGCIAAKAARMRVMAVPDSRLAGDPRFAIADLVLSSLTELSGAPAAGLLGLEGARR